MDSVNDVLGYWQESHTPVPNGIDRSTDALLVKTLTMREMEARAAAEARIILEAATFGEIDSLMREMPEGGSKRKARSRNITRATSGRVDAGTMRARGTRQPRGLHGHSYKPRKSDNTITVKIDPNAAKVAKLAALRSRVDQSDVD